MMMLSCASSHSNLVARNVQRGKYCVGARGLDNSETTPALAGTRHSASSLLLHTVGKWPDKTFLSSYHSASRGMGLVTTPGTRIPPRLPTCTLPPSSSW